MPVEAAWVRRGWTAAHWISSFAGMVVVMVAGFVVWIGESDHGGLRDRLLGLSGF